MTLMHDLQQAIDWAADTASCLYLQLAIPAAGLIDARATLDNAVAARQQQLRQKLADQTLVLDPTAINDFLQALAEAQFIAFSGERDTPIEPVPTQVGIQTPDFVLVGNPDVTFEVKALSAVDGDYGIRDDLMASLTAKLDLEAQLRANRPAAFAEAETTPYGSKLRRGTTNKDLTQVLIDKARQNIKAGQFTAPQSFLVLDCTALPTLGRMRDELRPIHWVTDPAAHPVSGSLWMAAFGQPGMPIFGYPEWEGMPVIEGYLDRRGGGLLCEYDFLAGVIIVRRGLDGTLEAGALIRGHDGERWSEQGIVWPWLRLLIAHSWNDERDSHGFAL